MTGNQIFVSYAHPNLEVIKAEVEFLKSMGLNIWFDKDRLLAGQDWDREITKAIKESSIFLVNLSSKSYERRGYYQKEIRTALDVAMTIPPSQLYMMPVKLDSCEIIDTLAPYHVLDLFSENGTEMLMKSIGYALKIELNYNDKASSKFKNMLSQSIDNTFKDTNQDVIKITQKVEAFVVPKAIVDKLPILGDSAKAVLMEVLQCDKSKAKGLSFMLMSETQGNYVPYIWENNVHGVLNAPIIDLTITRMAAEELVEKGILKQFPQNNRLLQYAVKT